MPETPVPAGRASQLRRKETWAPRLKAVGSVLPFSVSRALARLNPWLGYLCAGRGEFVIRDYCGTLTVAIDAEISHERHMLTGSFEPHLLEAISKLVSPGFYCIDVGANVGAVTLPMAEAVGPTGKVFAVEPGPKFFDRLGKNLSLNAALVSRVSLHSLGLSDEEGTLYWAEDPDFPGNARLKKSGLPVPVTTLDLFVQRNSMPRLDFIKIDVEGMELQVLQGARESLKNFSPAILFESSMAFEAIRRKPIRKQTEAFLRSLGYDLFTLAGKPCTYPNFEENALAIKA